LHFTTAGTNKSALEMESIPISTKSSGGGGGGSRLSRLWGGGGGGSTDSTALNNSTLTTSPSDLHRREAELQRREADLARREASLAAAGAARKNWPKYLHLVHHDINADIPAQRRGLVRAAYFAWCLVATGYIFNFICMTAFFIGGSKKVSLWVFSGLVAVAGLPLSFLCWYRSLYWAAARDTGFRWGWAMLHLLAHIVWCWWMFVGITPDIGGYSAGLFTMLDQFSNGGGKGTAFGVMCVLNMVIFALCGVLSMGVLGKSWATLRSGGQAVPVDSRVVRV
jgi:secretory carrier-associated membrane protein